MKFSLPENFGGATIHGIVIEAEQDFVEITEELPNFVHVVEGLLSHGFSHFKEIVEEDVQAVEAKIGKGKKKPDQPVEATIEQVPEQPQ